MDAGINNVIYMEFYSGPKMANGRCGKTIDTGTIDRGSTIYMSVCLCMYIFLYTNMPILWLNTIHVCTMLSVHNVQHLFFLDPNWIPSLYCLKLDVGVFTTFVHFPV